MIYTFGECVLDTQRITLYRAGQSRNLRPKVLQVLMYLLEHRDHVIDKQELCAQVWLEQHVSDTTLESTLRAVRQAVGDSGKAQRIIQTLYGHGYRFVAALREPDEGLLVEAAPAASGVADAEHRQLTVLCCDLVTSTALATRLDPEALLAVTRAYYAACAAVVARFDGYVAQYLGAGLLVYFGFPQAHEDDAQRAVRAGLGMLDALQHVPGQAVSLRARVGIHTGPVVMGAISAGVGQARMALGETPQLAARVQAQAAPQTVVISAATWRLVAGWFVCQALEAQPLPGVSQPVPVYRILRERRVQSRLEVAGRLGLTPLVGRVSEAALLRERWAQARDWLGQVVLLSGEAGIGKSRLAEGLREQVEGEGALYLTLGGPLDPGTPQSVARSRPDHAYARPAALSSRVSSAVDRSHPPHPAHPDPLHPSPGGVDAGASHARQAPPRGGTRAGHCQDRWRAPVCRRARQDTAGSRADA